jgi:hypothetical protein
MSKTARTTDGKTMFWCPGCEQHHWVNDTWSITGTPDAPTFSPSVLVSYRHPKGYSNANPAPVGYDGEYVEDHLCHSFVTDGRIQFLNDCAHALAGQTVNMVDLEDGDGA